MSFRIDSTTTLARSAFLLLEELHVAGPDGATFDRVVVRHPGAVAVVPVTDEGDAILVRQYRAALDREVLEIPAGKRDVADEPPEETASRELIEEIGFDPGRLVSLGAFFNSPGFCDEETHLFLALDLTEQRSATPLRHEEASMRPERVALDQVGDLVTSRVIMDAKTVIGLLLARERLLTDGPHVIED